MTTKTQNKISILECTSKQKFQFDGSGHGSIKDDCELQKASEYQMEHEVNLSLS